MSVIVRGMEMPKDCRECRLMEYHCSTGETWCAPADGLLAEIFKPIPFDGRPDWCPLAELPEKHGDLIDRQTLKDAVLKWMPPDPCGKEEKEFPYETDICASMLMEIEEQDAVIEAEGEE